MTRAETLQSGVSSRARRVSAERVSTCFHYVAPEGVGPSRPFGPRILNPNSAPTNEPNQPNSAESTHSDASAFTPIQRGLRTETLQFSPALWALAEAAHRLGLGRVA